ncbi:UNKNOWN [Stylonychia lemnae]|uniref:Uncharacterized protein n=1 Tax=Stylonychia lemnae TaxID=5949 RepID=A0A077ZX49_STYLE|nr:UNKNOWN [Stylonychia lemnae]|eukprot:CDW73096.1 UNKNOWN [Stylonychia lemnae]
MAQNSVLVESNSSPFRRPGALCVSCSSKKELKAAMYRAFRKKYQFIIDLKNVQEEQNKIKVREEDQESSDSFRSIDFKERNKQKLAISLMGNKYRYKSKVEGINDLYSSKDFVNINQSAITILPEIDQKFKREFNDYDSAIKDIKNCGKYNGKKLRAAQAENIMIRKRNHEFFQELNTMSLGLIKKKFDYSRAIKRNYKNNSQAQQV